ncbi:MAG: hypothetical protein FJW86_02405 [Actinobacteria bacterium]|nr:hypothetical protein [Actinomycetota bacterium]
MRWFRGLTLAVVGTSMLVTSFVTTAGAAAPAKTKPPKWAAQVCTSLGDWVEQIETASATASATPPTTPADGKKALLKLIGTTIKATNKLLGQLKKAGTPAVDDGKGVAKVISDQVKVMQTALTSARSTVKTIPPDDGPAFVAQSRTAQDAIEAGIEGVNGAIQIATNLDDPALVAAFNGEAACTEITS